MNEEIICWLRFYLNRNEIIFENTFEYSSRLEWNIQIRFWFLFMLSAKNGKYFNTFCLPSSIKFTLFCTSSTTNHHLENIIGHCCCIIWTLSHEFYVTITMYFDFVLSVLYNHFIICSLIIIDTHLMHYWWWLADTSTGLEQ